FASGVLPLFLGFATRLVEYHLGDDKAYRATICFGATSTTDDLDGELRPIEGPVLDRAAVGEALGSFLGPQEQRPPAYSAIQVGGRRAYDLARAGDPLVLAARRITITRLELVEWDAADPERPIAIVEVECSAGTYVRSLARDLGAALGSGAYLGALVRTRSGPFALGDAVSLDALRRAAASGADAVAALLLPADAGLDAMPSVTLTANEIADAAMGRFIRPAAGIGGAGDGSVVRLHDDTRRLVGIARRDGRHLAPDKMARP
ncbi:MAG TPA: tRNA pseudouridine(55) synthase TruB, partial [Candidatus Limnocylindrales bacterium]|nr:tRNA pseudouridine(55) synthase TruB [Candidatus Limnocylindrales bacterium]